MRRSEGVMPPFGWGVVRIDYARREVVLAPIPLNWPIRWAQQAYWFLVRGPWLLTRIDRAVLDTVKVERKRAAENAATMYARGRMEGFDVGYQTAGVVAEMLLDKKQDEAERLVAERRRGLR